MPLLPAQQPRAELPSLPVSTSSEAPCMPVSSSSQVLVPPTPDLAKSLGLGRHPQEDCQLVSIGPASIGSRAGSPAGTPVCDHLLPPQTPTRGSEASSPNTMPSTPCAGSRAIGSPGGQPDEAAAQEQLAPAGTACCSPAQLGWPWHPDLPLHQPPLAVPCLRGMTVAHTCSCTLTKQHSALVVPMQAWLPVAPMSTSAPGCACAVGCGRCKHMGRSHAAACFSSGGCRHSQQAPHMLQRR